MNLHSAVHVIAVTVAVVFALLASGAARLATLTALTGLLLLAALLVLLAGLVLPAAILLAASALLIIALIGQSLSPFACFRRVGGIWSTH